MRYDNASPDQASPADSPQIGLADIDRAALALDGTQLTLLVQELEAELDVTSAADAPADGWRVLRRYMGGTVVLGAPTDPTMTTWRLANYQAGESDSTVRVHPDAMALRPSRAERRNGLTLRWPAVMTDRSSSELFVIDVVNRHETRWLPNGDGFHTVGVFTKPGVTEFSFGWASLGQEPAAPLDPGDYARVAVRVDQGFWTSAEPGLYDLHAVVVDLSLRTNSPLPVSVSADMIARHRARSQQRQPTAELRRSSLDARIRHLRTQAAAGNSLLAIAEIVTHADTDADALVQICALLDCDESTAESIYHTSLRELRPASKERLEREIAELVRRRSSL